MDGPHSARLDDPAASAQCAGVRGGGGQPMLSLPPHGQ